MVPDGFFQLAEVHVLPRRGLHLLAGVGPEVAVVEVHHHVHAQVLGAHGLHYHIFHVAPSAVLRRVDPYAKTDGIKAAFLHQSGAFTLLAGRIVETMALALHLGHPTDVRTFGKIHRFRCIALLFSLFLGSTATGRKQEASSQHKTEKTDVFHDYFLF